ncbi:unnamed protein product [Urochloa decumbens]|uniref:serine O-acetyltransferase n=1 Tax=Urochloa decumbens TaxID=240449 RepID=A0ABC9GUH7_9POAL
MTAGQPLHADTSHHHPHQRAPRHHSAASNNPHPAALDAAVVPSYPPPESDGDESWVWSQIKAEARRDADAEPALASFLYATVLSHPSLARSLGPAHRVVHVLWAAQDRRALALALQSRVAKVFAVDVHPAASVGKGVLLDHATGVVIGETAVVGDNVSILHHVTLGGTGKAVGDRHPKIGDGVLIGAGATILGNVRIGAGANVGAGSVVLIDVPPGSTAVGNPARLIRGKKGEDDVVMIMPGEAMDHTSFVQQRSDYII